MCHEERCLRSLSIGGRTWDDVIQLSSLDEEVYTLYGNPALRHGMSFEAAKARVGLSEEAYTVDEARIRLPGDGPSSSFALVVQCGYSNVGTLDLQVVVVWPVLWSNAGSRTPEVTYAVDGAWRPPHVWNRADSRGSALAATGSD